MFTIKKLYWKVTKYDVCAIPCAGNGKFVNGASHKQR